MNNGSLTQCFKGVIFSILSFFILSCAYSSEKQAIACDGQYVLCSAAPCQPIPGIQGRAICHCSVWQGINLGYSSCEQRKAHKGEYGETQLLSTFSLGGMHYRYMTCAKSSAWTFCLDQQCVVDKNDPRKASCNCKIEKPSTFVTFAGECDSKACNKSMWSGALPADNAHFIELISKKMNLTKPAARACQSPR